MAWTSWIANSRPARQWSFPDLGGNVSLWQQRARSRRQLLWLDDRLLQDIGIDRVAAEEEARKPFWRG